MSEWKHASFINGQSEIVRINKLPNKLVVCLMYHSISIWNRKYRMEENNYETYFIGWNYLVCVQIVSKLMKLGDVAIDFPQKMNFPMEYSSTKNVIALVVSIFLLVMRDSNNRTKNDFWARCNIKQYRQKQKVTPTLEWELILSWTILFTLESMNSLS